jgi:hypothetical protein
MTRSIASPKIAAELLKPSLGRASSAARLATEHRAALPAAA